jgi:hypothetical protein
MKTATQARQYYLKKARKAIKQTISASIKHGNCYATITFGEESFKLAKDHAFWLASMGYNCVLNEDEMKLRVSWI